MKSPGEPVWPNLFLVGAPKAGTTSLHATLAAHPDIFMADPKEPHFFSTVEALPAWRGETGATRDDLGRTVRPVVRSQDRYLAMFATSSRFVVRGEASTSYLADPHAAESIFNVVPEARIVAVVRDPVARAYSHYFMHVREGWEGRSFKDAIRPELNGDQVDWPYRYVGSGFYASDLERFRALFGDRVYIAVFDDLVADPAGAMQRLYDFLGVGAPAHASCELPRLNRHNEPRNRFLASVMKSSAAWRVGRRALPRNLRHAVRDAVMAPSEKPPMDKATESLLRAHFAPDVRSTEELIGRSVPWSSSAGTS